MVRFLTMSDGISDNLNPFTKSRLSRIDFANDVTKLIVLVGSYRLINFMSPNGNNSMCMVNTVTF